jgi:hypothetical protein
VLDPFGASPRLAVEVARTGRGILVAAANPVTRFVLERTARPAGVAAFQSALSRLAASPKDAGRLEPFVLDLYATACSQCGHDVSAEYFVWERERGQPVRRAYTCPNCSHVAEEPVTAADIEKAGTFESQGLARARALEQVAPADDPDRASAEAALAVYPGRAVYALISVLNKLEQINFEPEARAAAEALLLSAFDSANALWGHPEGRTRPRQLTASPHFREMNVWRSLERAMDEWNLPDPGIQVSHWQPGTVPAPGEVAIFSGPARDLVPSLRGLPIEAVVTVLPRPNQAQWTLSALWTAWLWGRKAAAPMRAALRRRRYDWAWHASALRASLAGLAAALRPGMLVLTFVPEAEPGFLGAGFAGLDAGGFRLTGRALRAEEEQALLAWEVSPGPATGVEVGLWRTRLTDAAQDALEAWAQPARFEILHAAAWSDLASRRWLSPLWSEDEDHPMGRVADEFGKVLADRKAFVRLDTRSDPETGVFWLSHPSADTAPWADRVELSILEILRRHGEAAQAEVEEEVCQQFPGLLTPDRAFMRACLFSYATEETDSGGRWILREQDLLEARRADREAVLQLVMELAARIGYHPSGNDPVRWRDAGGREVFVISVRETAAFGDLLEGPAADRAVAVIPGGRGALVAEKARRDPRLENWLRDGSRVVKYRHLRRLAEEATLKPENFVERLAIDPPGREDPQLPLL